MKGQKGLDLTEPKKKTLVSMSSSCIRNRWFRLFKVESNNFGLLPKVLFGKLLRQVEITMETFTSIRICKLFQCFLFIFTCGEREGYFGCVIYFSVGKKIFSVIKKKFENQVHEKITFGSVVDDVWNFQFLISNLLAHFRNLQPFEAIKC